MIWSWSSLTITIGTLVLAPCLLGIIPRVKAWFAGRQGQPLFQVYYDLAKLMRKGAVYSTTTTWLFRFGPVLGLVTMLAALVILPLVGFPAVLKFTGDFLLFAYLLALARFFMILTAMDTGSSFEGMGASREATFSTLTEPILFLALATLVKHSGMLSLSDAFAQPHLLNLASLVLISMGLGIMILVENCRIPIDDPNTHLELTMIHEVMVLDNSGPDLALILYTASLKLWITVGILAQLLIPTLPGPVWGRPLCVFACMIGLTIAVGIIESIMARTRLAQIPKLIVGADLLVLLGFMVAR